MHSDFLLKCTSWKREWNEVQWRNVTDKHYLSRVIKVKITVINQIGTPYPWYNVMKMALYFLWTFSFAKISLVKTLEKHQTNPNVSVEYSTKYLTSAPQNFQVHQNKKERLRKCYSQQEPKETCWLSVMWYLRTPEKRALVENWENLDKL